MKAIYVCGALYRYYYQLIKSVFMISQMVYDFEYIHCLIFLASFVLLFP